jgi:hypothetical protein
MALIHLHADDNAAIASGNLAMDERVRFEQGDVIVLEPVGLGHKVAVPPSANGGPVSNSDNGSVLRILSWLVLKKSFLANRGNVQQAMVATTKPTEPKRLFDGPLNIERSAE